MALTTQDALKRMLAIVGESTSLQSGDSAYDLANVILQGATVETLSLGWHFNTTYNTDGSIASISTLASFDDVPEHIQAYILAKAMHEFSLAYTGENVFSQDFLTNVQNTYVTARNRDAKEAMPGVTYDILYQQIENELKAEFNVQSLDGLMVSYAKLKAKRLLALYTKADGINHLQPGNDEVELYQRILSKYKRDLVTPPQVSDIAASIAALTGLPATDADIQHYAQMKADRLTLAYESGNSEALLQIPQEELQALQGLLTRSQREKLKAINADSYDDIFQAIKIQLLNEKGWWYNTVIDDNGEKVLNIPVSLPAEVEEYAKAKAKRLYTAYTTNDVNLLLNPSPEEQELFAAMQKANEEHWNLTPVSRLTYDEILEDIRSQLRNETGWWFNSQPNTAEGGILEDAPLTLPSLVEEYAQAKAERIFLAYNSKQWELLLQPTPREQGLYSKMLQVHNQNMIKAKDIDTLREEVMMSLLQEGWDFNTFEGTYADMKAKYGNDILKIESIYSTKNILTTKDANGFVIGIDRTTGEEVDDGEQVKVIVKMLYSDLPYTVQSYIDLKASRLYKYYNDPKQPLAYAQPTPEETQMYWRLRANFVTDVENANILDYNDFDSFYY